MKMGMDFWVGHVAAAKRDGDSTSAYAKRHGLSVAALYYWQRKLKSKSATQTEPAKVSKFVALRVADAGVAQYSSACTLVLSSGMRLEMNVLPSPQWLVALGHAAQETR